VALTPGARLGPYEITALIGEGGMGVVYAGFDQELQRPVAIKTIREDLVNNTTVRERFKREARLVANINHRHVCRVHEIGEVDGQLFIVMELLEGESLSSRLQKGPLRLRDATTTLLEILAALGALHERGVVHRDLKPSNVFLTADGVKLVDFGVARHTADMAQTGPDVTTAGAIVGTLRYMAPEQLLSEPVDIRTDLFAAGCILYESLAARPAFDADSLADAINRILNQEPPSLIGSPAIAAADRVIQRALSRTPSARYATASAMADAVRSLLVYGAPEGAGNVSEARTGKSIAVLPFVSIGNDPDGEDFADGVTEDVIACLSKIHSVKIIARASVMVFKARARPLKEIGARLGVRTLLDGSIRRAGAQVRIVTQLIDAATEAQLWSETYDRQLTDIFAIQTEVAEQIARALEAELTSDERARLGKKPTRNMEAYQLFLKGRHCFFKYTPEGCGRGSNS
jgi:serine/threonine protein kinase